MPNQPDITVKYNGITISPTPLVQQSYQFIDFGNRWGNILQIELGGQLTGITSTGSLSGLINIFSGQFGTLDVTQGASGIYSWNNMYVEEITIPENHYYTNSFTPYNVKLRRHNVPSGVLDPINEYTFTQNEDGIVTINHRVSAKGIKDNNGSFYNAVLFVKSLTGKNPFSPSFMPDGTSVLLSLSENINRVEGIYNVSEVYKYNTGSSVNYIETFNINITDDIANQYNVIDSTLKIQGSPINNNFNNIESSGVLICDVMNRISALGIATGNLMRNSFQVNRDSNAIIFEVKQSFLSGYSASDLAGFFDYNITFGNDLTFPRESWRVEGDFVCKGPLNYKLQQLATFKSTNGANWRTYLSGLIVNSPPYTTYHTGIPFSHSIVEIQENTGLAQFHASLSFVDTANSNTNAANAKYTVDISPSKWTFDALASANIEGHYVVQDLQMMTQGRLNFNVSCDTNSPALALPVISGYVTNLEAIYINPNMSGSVMVETVATGFFDASFTREWIGFDTMSSGILNTKVVGSTLSNYIREAGFLFGY